MLTTSTHRCSLQLAPDASVDDAVSQATVLLRNVVESKGKLGAIGEHISVSVLPSAIGSTSVRDWARRNLGQAPMIVVKSDESEDNFSICPRRVEADQEDTFRKLQLEHSQMMANLQKLLRAQAKTIEQQGTYIDDLSGQEKQMAQLFASTISRVQVNIASLKGDFLDLEERIMQVRAEDQQNASNANIKA